MPMPTVNSLKSMFPLPSMSTNDMSRSSHSLCPVKRNIFKNSFVSPSTSAARRASPPTSSSEEEEENVSSFCFPPFPFSSPSPAFSSSSLSLSLSSSLSLSLSRARRRHTRPARCPRYDATRAAAAKRPRQTAALPARYSRHVFLRRRFLRRRFLMAFSSAFSSLTLFSLSPFESWIPNTLTR